jgi:hypothetical protein
MANAFEQALQKAIGGYLADRLIVTMNAENEPEVCMFVLNADNQLLRVSYGPEGGDQVSDGPTG